MAVNLIKFSEMYTYFYKNISREIKTILFSHYIQNKINMLVSFRFDNYKKYLRSKKVTISTI
ncbi:hypothetical protein DM790_03890 [Flavobacterium collinsii]|nr:hypothetical protein [Flavobacterium collinsii]